MARPINVGGRGPPPCQYPGCNEKSTPESSYTYCPNHEDHDSRFRFFWGAASGSAQKSLRQLKVRNVMISYTTKNNRPWEGIQNLFLDSGGYSLMLESGEHEPIETYYDYLELVTPELYAYQDYPCEPEILEKYERTVEEHQQKCTERYIGNAEEHDRRNIKAEPAAVVQGWEPEDYARHVDDLRDHGLLTDTLGIGSVCRRNAEGQIKDVIRTVDEATPVGTELHAFGVKRSVLQHPEVRRRLTSADSCAYDYMRDTHIRPYWQNSAKTFLEMREAINEMFQGSTTASEQETLDAVNS